MKYFVILMTLCLSLQVDYIWLEGEKTTKASVKKHGCYGHLNPRGSNIMDPEPDQLDKCWRMVAAMKKEGIYSTVSPTHLELTRKKMLLFLT